ncbi:MAG: flagellar basal body P-ring protein FlgI [Syntrophobacteraceae bacterium]|nr:flagellar basal body P-ring protein FlgI [Desulfobacteraceae bacterium]
MHVNRRPALLLSVLLSALILFAGSEAYATRIKDIAYFLGTRPNMLIGYGLVVGLNGTGDNTNTLFTVNTLGNLLDNMGIHVDPGQVKIKNVAAVMVTAKLPPFARVGTRIDVEASSIGDAKSLAGGTLLMTQLQGPDGKTYAIAQGPVATGGFAISGASGSSVQKNHPTVGTISEGALVEKEVSVSYDSLHRLDLVLKTPDFTTANKTAAAVNQALGGQVAQAVDGTTIRIEVPPSYKQDSVAMLTRIENLEVQPEMVAKVVINEKTGTIVMGESVRISPVAIAHGNLTVQITEKPAVSQPLPLSQGKTTVVPQTSVQVQEGKASLAVIGGGVTIGEVIQGLNAIGATPRDLVNILQAIRAAGALQAELEMM